MDKEVVFNELYKKIENEIKEQYEKKYKSEIETLKRKIEDNKHLIEQAEKWREKDLIYNRKKEEIKKEILKDIEDKIYEFIGGHEYYEIKFDVVDGPKCNLCDEDRNLVYTHPSGKILKVKCDCAKVRRKHYYAHLAEGKKLVIGDNIYIYYSQHFNLYSDYARDNCRLNVENITCNGDYYVDQNENIAGATTIVTRGPYGYHCFDGSKVEKTKLTKDIIFKINEHSALNKILFESKEIAEKWADILNTYSVDER